LPYTSVQLVFGTWPDVTAYAGSLSNVAFTSAGFTATVSFDRPPYSVFPPGQPISSGLGQVVVATLFGRMLLQTTIGPLQVGGCAPPKHSTSTGVSCSPLVFAPGDATVCTATVTDTAKGGQSTPTGTVSFSSSGADSFGGNPCTLSGSGASASCVVVFSSLPLGGRVITASYGGDSTHESSTGMTLVAVEVPASSDGCVVFGHGRITAADRDRASFRGVAVASPSRGAEFYRDNGPANVFRLVSTSVDAVTCSADATQASVFGRAKLNGAGSVEYRIDVHLAAWEWGKDTYRIRLSNGYDSGAQPIRHGDLDIRLRDRDHQHRDPNANQSRTGQQDGG
jgi:hypothetical protein